jgi:hypothetical protein
MIWFASYPKSGNTWVRTIIQEMVAPGLKPTVAIPSLIKEFPDDAPVFDIMGTRAKIIKTHCHTAHKRLRRITDNVIGVITIHRHPLDVMLSYINFSYVKKNNDNFKGGILKTVTNIIHDGDLDYYVDEFIALDGCKEYSKICRSWSQYYGDWAAVAGDGSHLELCYEELAEYPVEGVERIRTFLRLPPMDIPELLFRVEQQTSLDGRFFWRKKAYNFQDLIPEASIRRFENHFAESLTRLGYRGESVGEARPIRSASLKIF